MHDTLIMLTPMHDTSSCYPRLFLMYAAMQVLAIPSLTPGDVLVHLTDETTDLAARELVRMTPALDGNAYQSLFMPSGIAEVPLLPYE